MERLKEKLVSLDLLFEADQEHDTYTYRRLVLQLAPNIEVNPLMGILKDIVNHLAEENIQTRPALLDAIARFSCHLGLICSDN